MSLALYAANFGDFASWEARLRRSQDCRVFWLALSDEISGLHGSLGLVHFSGGSRPKVGNSIAGQVHQRS